ncbi:hypothetical protein DYU11_21945 [Fibrisoma montanum]|uniref:Uncharacterized protein n=1 Tax=Fibrisoma montanum TaxID=2305895 RepID=A0A418M4F6_9BACT|nr:hypothetical protein DYU11_21945 [Fibrisoma montanum]
MEKNPRIDPTRFKQLAEDYVTLVNARLAGSIPNGLREKYTRLINTIYKPQPPFRSNPGQ